MIEAAARLVEGVVGNPESLVEESHEDGLLEYPSYTKPAVWRELKTPEVLLGGNHAAIATLRREQQLRARLVAEPARDIVSTFTNLRVAEDCISKLMRVNAATIKAWAQAGNKSMPLELVGDAGKVAGFGVVRLSGQVVKLSKVRLVLKFKSYNGMPYYVLTAYLIP
jgi:hypothetical protein